MPLSEAHKRISTTKKLSEILLFDRRFTTSPTTDALFSECFQYETAVPAGLFARLTGSRNVQRPDHRQEAALGHRRRCHPRVHHQPAQESTLNNKNERLWMESIHSFPLIFCSATAQAQVNEAGWRTESPDGRKDAFLSFYILLLDVGEWNTRNQCEENVFALSGKKFLQERMGTSSVQETATPKKEELVL